MNGAGNTAAYMTLSPLQNHNTLNNIVVAACILITAFIIVFAIGLVLPRTIAHPAVINRHAYEKYEPEEYE